MSETIHDRIKEMVDRLASGKNTVFANTLGVSEANIRGYIKNITPKYDVLRAIVTSYGVSAHWLLTGEGEMIEKKVTKPTPEPTNETESDAYLRGQIDALNKSNKDLQDNLRMLYQEVGRLKERLKTATASLTQKDT